MADAQITLLGVALTFLICDFALLLQSAYRSQRSDVPACSNDRMAATGCSARFKRLYSDATHRQDFHS